MSIELISIKVEVITSLSLVTSAWHSKLARLFLPAGLGGSDGMMQLQDFKHRRRWQVTVARRPGPTGRGPPSHESASPGIAESLMRRGRLITRARAGRSVSHGVTLSLIVKPVKLL
eukprot:g45315.t1